MAGEARSRPGVGKCSVTGPKMGGLRVALRTLSVECRLLRESDPRRYCGQNYIRAGRRPGAPKWVPGQEEAAGVSVKVVVLSERGPAAFCGADHRQHGGRLDRVQTTFRRSGRRNAPRWS